MRGPRCRTTGRRGDTDTPLPVFSADDADAHRPSSVIAKTGPPASSVDGRREPEQSLGHRAFVSPQDRPVPAPRWHRRGEFSSSHARSRTPSSGSGKAGGLVETPSSRRRGDLGAVAVVDALDQCADRLVDCELRVRCRRGWRWWVVRRRVPRGNRRSRPRHCRRSPSGHPARRCPGPQPQPARGPGRRSGPPRGCSHVVVTSRSHTGMTSPASDRWPRM